MNEADARDDPTPFDGPGLKSTARSDLAELRQELAQQRAAIEARREVLKRSRDGLAAVREQHMELFDLAPVGHATLDAEGRVITANPALGRLVGIDYRRLIGTFLTQRMAVNDAATFERLLARLLRERAGTGSCQVTMRGVAGRTVPVMLQAAAAAAEEEGRFPPTIRIAVINLTQLRAAQKVARDRLAHLEAVLDTVVDGIVTVDQTGKIESCNAAAARMFRAMPTWLVGRHVERVIPGFMAQVGADRAELVAERDDGTRFPVEVGVSELNKPSGVPRFNVDELRAGLRSVNRGPDMESERARKFVGVVTDISERKRRAAELDEALARFRQIAANIDDAFYIAEVDSGKVLYVSPAFECIYGRTPDEAADVPWPRLDWVHEQDRERVATASEELKSGAGSMDIEYRVVRPDGSIRAVRNRAFRTGEQNRLAGILHDMTEELALPAELRQAQRLEAIGTLASGVAHDFNNLLMGIGGCAQLALRKLEPGHEAYGYLRRAADAILRGANLTRQILRFSDARRSSDEPVEIDTVVSGARDLIHSLVGEHIALSIVTGAPGLSIAIDPGDLEQVLLNLASNARDAMPDGGLLTVRTTPFQGGKVALSVRDSGVGMSEETKQRIFEPFFTTKEIGKGTGLGLSTVFAVVRRMGGTISLESAPGEGTSFTLYLPVVVTRTSDASALADEEATTGKGETILIVDDDPLIRLTVETYVQTLGYRALTASSVTDALRIYTESARPIDVVLTDIMMPGLLGSDLGRILQKSRPDLAVIFMSAQPWQDLTRQGHVKENATLLAKPFDARELGAALHKALKDKPPSKRPDPVRVFVVDDDTDVVETLRDLLQMEGHTVGVAQTSADALAKIPEFAPEVVLCDLNVDEAMNGIDLVSRLRGHERLTDTVFLAVTGMSAAQCEPAALEAGFREVLTKPIDFHRLSRLLTSRVRA